MAFAGHTIWAILFAIYTKDGNVQPQYLKGGLVLFASTTLFFIPAGLIARMYEDGDLKPIVQRHEQRGSWTQGTPACDSCDPRDSPCMAKAMPGVLLLLGLTFSLADVCVELFYFFTLHAPGDASYASTYTSGGGISATTEAFLLVGICLLVIWAMWLIPRGAIIQAVVFLMGFAPQLVYAGMFSVYATDASLNVANLQIALWFRMGGYALTLIAFCVWLPLGEDPYDEAKKETTTGRIAERATQLFRR
jgi:hypothetical protein